MRIQKLKIRNILGAKEIDIAPAAGIVLFAGPNNSGKSSIANAITAAFTGDIERVALKKNLGTAVTEGQKTGNVMVETDIGTVTFEAPTGKSGEAYNQGTAPDLIERIKYCIGVGRFTAMTDKERKQFLMDITGVRMSVTEVESRLLKRDGVTEQAATEMIEVVREKGYDVASKYASDHAKQTKGRWSEVTGENWGAAKAVGWRAPVPDVDLRLMAGAREAAKKARQLVKDATAAVEQFKGAQAEAKRKAAHFAETKAKLRPLDQVEIERDDAREALERAQAALKVATKALNDLPEPSAAAKSENAGEPPQVLKAAVQILRAAHQTTLITDGVRAVDEVGAVSITPWVGIPWASKAGAFLTRYNEMYESKGPMPTAEDEKLLEKRAEATAALTSADRFVGECEKAVETANAAVAQCRQAHELVASMDDGAGDKEAFDADELERLVSKARQATSLSDEAEAALKPIEEADLALQASEKKNARAAALHAEIVAYDTCAKALAPDGIPGEIVGESLAPMNKLLRDTAELSGWPQVSIAPDMSLLYGTRAQGLCSESEKWRIDAMVGAAIATQTGVRFVMLDRIDALNVENRTKLMMWLRRAVQQGSLEGAVLFGTLKERPKLPEADFAPYWIENGRLL